MQPAGHHRKHNHFRTYLVFATVVIAGIFIVLLVNNEDLNLHLGGAAVGFDGTNQDGTTNYDDTNIQYAADGTKIYNDPSEIQEPYAQEKQPTVDFDLHFDSMPSLEQYSKVNELTLKFDDLTTKIQVNNDQLELNNLQEVTLTIKDFDGTITLDSNSISMSGLAARLEVNDVALASKSQISLSFSNLNYNQIEIDSIDIPYLQFPRGQGTIDIEGRLQYDLISDEVLVENFQGSLDTTKDIFFTGLATRVSVDGDLVSFDVD